MTEVLEKKRLRIVSHCHLRYLRIPAPHIPPDPKLFPATTGFESCSIVTVIGWFGNTFQLVDVSGLTRAETEEQVRNDFKVEVQVEALRFFQCLEWIHKDTHHEKFTFKRIVVYPVDDTPMVAVSINTGFESTPYQGDDVPWGPGTLCLLYIPSM